jgi:hypothetical protein
MGQAAQRHNTRRRRRENAREQMHGQREVSEIIGAQLHFEAVGCHVSRRDRHHAGIVDEQIEMRDRPRYALRAGCNGGKTGEIEWLEADISAGDA